MDMPKPGDAHRRLQQLVGRWEGVETIHPSPWAPDGGTAVGRFDLAMGLDGFFLVSDYEQARDGQVVFRGHGVYGWDAEAERYTMHWFDSVGNDPGAPVPGTWGDDALVFQGQSEMGYHRYVYDRIGAESFAFRIEGSRDGAQWSVVMEGEYRRRPA